jgi:hypothetical protein
MEDTKTFTLIKPIKFGDAPEITELTLVEPTAGQIEAALKEPSTTTANIVLIAAISKIPAAAVRAMALRDFNTCVAFLEGFTKGEESEGD